jgi:hypothetical protein
MAFAGALLCLSCEQASAQSIDACLVGTWEATTVTALRAPGIGGEGYRVTFAADGTQTIDYAQTKLWTTSDGSVTTLFWGTAKGRISTQNKTVRLDGIEQAEVMRKVTWTDVVTEVRPVPGLGPGGLGTTANDNGYDCSQNSLEYKTSMVEDRGPTHSVKLVREKDSTPSPAAVAINGKTWLTVTEIKDRPQDLQGAWNDPTGESDSKLMWLRNTPASTLTAHSFTARDGDPTILDMTAAGNLQWQGKVGICPRPKGTCPNLCRWVSGSLRTDANQLSIGGEWHDRKHKPDCSGLGDEPNSDAFTIKRVLGVSFVPIAPGKYMNLGGAPAVGNQPAQFKAAVLIAARYDDVPGARVRATVDGARVTPKDRSPGTYDFVAERSGVYELRFELLDADDKVFHTDRMRIEIPSIPGLGN